MPHVVIQISDTHIFADPSRRLGGCDTRRSLLAVLTAIRRERIRADALLITGDLAEKAEPEAYAWLSACLQDTELPFAVLPGNHDHPARLAAAAWGARGQNGGSLHIGRWQCVLLDTCVVGVEHGELARFELDRLAAIVRAADARPLLIAMHHPAIAIGSPWMDAMGLRNSAAFWAAVAPTARLRGVICGHIHQNFDRRRGAVRMLGVPSTCVQFAPGATRFAMDARPPGYRRLELHDDGRLRTRVVRVPDA